MVVVAVGAIVLAISTDWSSGDGEASGGGGGASSGSESDGCEQFAGTKLVSISLSVLLGFDAFLLLCAAWSHARGRRWYYFAPLDIASRGSRLPAAALTCASVFLFAGCGYCASLSCVGSVSEELWRRRVPPMLLELGL
eukprot:6007118-Pleurochrysis_carterae.AAC.1